MILGHGDIARAIPAHLDRPSWVWFASGVSNSAETRESEYAREAQLLGVQDREAHLIYFSSLCVFYSNNRYARHKGAMEDLVRNWFDAYTIIRLGTITWGRNPHLLINHLHAQHAAGLELDIQPVQRYVVDLAEFQNHLALLPEWSCEYNITGRRMTVQQIVDEYVVYRGVPAWK